MKLFEVIDLNRSLKNKNYDQRLDVKYFVSKSQDSASIHLLASIRPIRTSELAPTVADTKIASEVITDELELDDELSLELSAVQEAEVGAT